MIEKIAVLCKCGLLETLYLEDGQFEGFLTIKIEGGRVQGNKGGNLNGKFYAEGSNIYHRHLDGGVLCTILGKERE